MSFAPNTPHHWMLAPSDDDADAIRDWALDDSDDDFGRVSSCVPVVRRPADGSGLGASNLSPTGEDTQR